MSSTKKIILGVTGSIAAYKSAELIRQLHAMGAEVRVVMSPGAKKFITPLTLQALSKNPVRTQVYDEQAEAAMSHIELARWADKILIAPANADVLAQLAAGMASDLLTTLCLATQAPIVVAPAMNQQMWQHPATQSNYQVLQQRGVTFIGPEYGEQACGEHGPGRMAEPQEIIKKLIAEVATGRLIGKKVMITAGPTYEPIDPVRFISNHSSGKMGYAITQAAVQAGAEVTLVSGPVNLEDPFGALVKQVTTAQEMLDTVMQSINDCDIFIATAAVSDYRVQHVASQKLKKSSQPQILSLVENPDILALVAALSPKPFSVGFAAETENVLANAQEKLTQKQIDLIVANKVGTKQGGFGSDENEVSIISVNKVHHIPLTSKQAIAERLIDEIASLCKSR